MQGSSNFGIMHSGAVVVSTFLVGVAMTSGAATAATTLPKQPNFVFVLADDWGLGDVGAYVNATFCTAPDSLILLRSSPMRCGAQFPFKPRPLAYHMCVSHYGVLLLQ
jgi:hypothetical protein